MSAKFLGNVILKGKLECITGLHIGGSKERFEIGGVDSPVIRDPHNNYPYIPGTSLKGKMRSLLAFALNKADNDPADPKKYDETCPLQRIFGIGASENVKKGQSRLIVRDSYPDSNTVEMWKSLDSSLLYTEYKPENTINRLTSAANPRFMERVVKGSMFNIELVFGIFDIDNQNDAEYFAHLIEAMRLLEHSYIGGSGSRGYGQIEFKFMKPIIVKNDDYLKGSDTFKQASKDIDELINTNERWWKRLSEFNEYIDEVKSTFPKNV